MTMQPSFLRALPFWMSLLFVPMIAISGYYGGIAILLVPFYTWIVVTVLDMVSGLEIGNMDPQTQDKELFWYKAITMLWLPVQVAIIFGALIMAFWSDHLSLPEQLLLMISVGIVTGSVGINYAHELIHQKNRLEQFLGEWLLISTCYGHFRSEHIYVHHRYIGTPRDPVTARYDEDFYHFFPRVMIGQVTSAWEVEVARLRQRGRPWYHYRNPFYRYVGGSAAFAAVAYLIGGWLAVSFFLLQSFMAMLQLELVNYVEHYGLTRRHLGEGKYEHVHPRHSWNAAHRLTNFLLINLQRHSDHHFKPDRRFPLLQNYDHQEAPQLPYGYPLMTLSALVPPFWRRLMNRRVQMWREKHYPDIEDWTPYNMATNPLPR
ncbi:alkane 1-monooxygenase [Algicella marina]|uniref:Alkane 1-monooxygenase n=1 Tax=Algicella marina TaxID=2683284 RepID=A0A6P1T835_9RHOB|nr:alkane 1-monooxygenase [Algicella marina]QHQ36762.1 alkane 1-monooxygenase [Algicella marina]